jgi:hypothetical protein
LTFLVPGATINLSFEVLPSANAGVTQLVECDLAKVDVAGSNPVSRSNFNKADPHSTVPRTDISGRDTIAHGAISLCNYRYFHNLGNGRRRALVSHRPTPGQRF